MKKQPIVVGIAILLIVVALMGCNSTTPDNDNNGELPDMDESEPSLHLFIGDSTIFNYINFTFVNAYTAVRFIDEFEIFTIEINATNTESFGTSGYVTAIYYKMYDGTKYDATYSTDPTAFFTLGPWESKISFIRCSEDEIDIDYSQIAQVYLSISGKVDLVLHVLME